MAKHVAKRNMKLKTDPSSRMQPLSDFKNFYPNAQFGDVNEGVVEFDVIIFGGVGDDAAIVMVNCVE